MCVNVSSRRGAVCNTNHHLLCARLCLKQGTCSYMYVKRVPAGLRGMRFHVEKPTSASVVEGDQEQVMEKVGKTWPEGRSMEEKWMAVSCALTVAVNKTFL